MKKLLLAGYFFLMGCGPQMTLMVHPKTGERVTCRAFVVPHVVPITLNQSGRETCIEQYSAVGFIEAEKLTPEQRENIPARK